MTILPVGDLHCPFMHPDAVKFLAAICDKHPPNKVVMLGDEIDAHAYSDYTTDPDGLSPGHELDKAIDQLRDIYDLFPKAMICESNHTIRPFKKAFSSGLPSRMFKSMQQLIEAPKGWRWADHWVVDGIRFEHGEGTSGETAHMKATKGNMQSTVIGHIHSHAGINYLKTPTGKLLFGMNVGCLINVADYAFKYAKHVKAKPTLGCGLIVNGVPTYIPMRLNANGRWNRLI